MSSPNSTNTIANRMNSENNLNAITTQMNNSSFTFSYEFTEEQEQCIQMFDRWSPIEQTEFVENLLRRMCHFQHGHINNFLKPMLQRDFISSLPGLSLSVLSNPRLIFIFEK